MRLLLIGDPTNETGNEYSYSASDSTGPLSCAGPSSETETYEYRVLSGKHSIPFHSRIGKAVELLTLPPDPLLDVLAYD